MITPRSFSSSIGSIDVPSGKWRVVGVCLVPKRIDLHLAALKWRSHLVDQLWRAAMSVSIMEKSWVSVMGWNILVSSANIYKKEVVMLGSSFMNMVNKVGPRTEPCGTPLLTSWMEDEVPLMTTHCFLP